MNPKMFCRMNNKSVRNRQFVINNIERQIHPHTMVSYFENIPSQGHNQRTKGPDRWICRPILSLSQTSPCFYVQVF